MQAVSGAGRSPGVIALDILDNVIPYIPKEEGKVEVETKKILGRWAPGASAVEPHGAQVSATCTRVAVLDGHTEAVSVVLGRAGQPEEVAGRDARLEGQPGGARSSVLAPPRWIEVLDDPSALSRGSTATPTAGWPPRVGRIREDAVLENGIKYVLVSHNTKMGAAKGAVLVAELLRARGFLGR